MNAKEARQAAQVNRLNKIEVQRMEVDRDIDEAIDNGAFFTFIDYSIFPEVIEMLERRQFKVTKDSYDNYKISWK